MNKVDVLLGLQWGDEGKGKIVDVITPEYDVIVRFQGGPNAGHTLKFNNIKHVLHHIPSGVFHPDKINIIGNGVVIDPEILSNEVEKIEKLGFDIRKTLLISKKAHLILPTHKLLDAAYESAKGNSKIGSTLKGIGPAYTDKIGRNGLRIGDLDSDFLEKYTELKRRHISLLEMYDYPFDLDAAEDKWFAGLETIKEFQLIDSEIYINNALREGKSVIAEGAQGTMLDVDFGSYPYVTSSNTICAGACTGMGVAPSSIGEVYGIVKAYCTRVGSGPFPTELFDATGDTICEIGQEFGSTTGRRRRCGWIDLVALKYSIMINGVTKLIMMKTDVLDQFETINIATAYQYKNEIIDTFPFEIPEGLKPIYTVMPGWKKDLTNITSADEFPKELNDYIAFLEDQLEAPITIVSVGPDRKQTILRK